MPRQRATKPQTSFFRGLQTEASPLETPENYFDDGDNIELSPKSVSRRLGLGVEPTFQYSGLFAKSTIINDEISEHIWKSPGGNAGLTLYVLRIGATLYFYDNTQSPRSAFKKTYTVNLDDFLITGRTTSRDIPIYTSAGYERLFVVGEGLEPFYIEYTLATDSITTTQVDLKIRDFQDIEDGIAIDEAPTGYTIEHTYNMRNRGWVRPAVGEEDPYEFYETDQGTYPSKNTQWWQGKNATTLVFDGDLLDKFYSGTSSAPLGHYVVDAFNIDRAAASGLAGLPAVTTDKRPKAVSFYAGRCFWAVGNTVYFSKSIVNPSDINKCYQEYDPTSEDLSDLVASDGGTFILLGASDILALSQFGQYLLIYADNGVWAVSGADGIFRATDYSLNKLTDSGISSARSLVEVEGTQFFWGLDGIYTVTLDQVSQNPVIQNSTFNVINTFYNSITEFAKQTARGTYDRYNKKVRWIYTDQRTNPSNDIVDYTRVLTLDLRLQAWVPSSFPKLSESNTYPAVVGVSPLSSLTAFVSSDAVVTDTGDEVVTDTGDEVVILTEAEESNTFVGVKFLVLVEDGSNVKYTFCELNGTDFYDYKFVDGIGVSYSSYIEPGDERLGDIGTYKQTPYIQIFAKRTETEFVSNGDGSYDFDRPSSIMMTAYWDWSDGYGRVSPAQQVYRFPRNYIVNENNLTFNHGHGIIVTKNRLRGKGRTLRLRLESEAGKDFEIHGWSMLIDGNVNV